MKRFLIVAGDPSGDLVASKLVASLKKLNPDSFVVGIGGSHLRRVSDQFLENIVSQHALGFAISFKKICYFKNILNDIISAELKKNPSTVVIPVDFYGFNYRVAKFAKELGHQVFYYVSPQFWASRPGRANRLKPYVDLFLCLFPFEIDFYNARNLPATFVGHPILDSLPNISIQDEKILHVEGLVGLLPGSRPDEIRRHLPIMVDACEKISAQCPGTRYLLFTVPHVHADFYLDIIKISSRKRIFIELIQDEGYMWRAQLDAAITASGMETLENTLLGIPMVVMYKTNWLTYVIARCLIKIPYVGMPNVLANKQLVPELIQHNAQAKKIAQPIIDWLKNPKLRLALRQDLLVLKEKFGSDGASDRAAKAILEKVA